MRIIRCVLFCLLASLWLSGCAHVRQPPSAATRAGFGTVGIVSPATEIKGDFGAPTGGKGTGALKGAGQWAIASPLAGLYVGGVGVVFGVLFTPVAALTGAVYGAVVAVPGVKVKYAEDSIGSALKNIEIRQAMLDGVFIAARDKSNCNVMPVFTPLKEDAVSPGGGVGYHDLRESGVDTALVVAVTEYGLDTGAKGMDIDPAVPLILKVRARLVRCQDGKELYADEFTYKGPERKYLEWAFDGGKPLVDEINRACDTLARQVVDETLLGVPYAPYASPRKTTYVPGYEPKGDLFEPSDKHRLDDEEWHLW